MNIINLGNSFGRFSVWIKSTTETPFHNVEYSKIVFDNIGCACIQFTALKNIAKKYDKLKLKQIEILLVDEDFDFIVKEYTKEKGVIIYEQGKSILD